MLLLFSEGKIVPFVKTLGFFSFTNKLHRLSPGAWQSVRCGYRTVDVFSTGWLADSVLVLASRSKMWEARRTNMGNWISLKKLKTKM